MARTKASQMARKFANVEDSAESSEQDLDMVEGEEEVDKEQETAEGETGNKRFVAIILGFILIGSYSGR